MTVFNITRLSGVVGVLLVAGCVSAQTPSDPYNPQTRRTSASNPVIEPSLADMGFGTDEGNVGQFVTMTDKQYAQAMAAVSYTHLVGNRLVRT